MSELTKAGFSFFLSDRFDNLFTSWASPIKVAFTVGFVSGFTVAAGLIYFGPYKVVNAITDNEEQQQQQPHPPGLPPGPPLRPPPGQQPQLILRGELNLQFSMALDDMLTFLQELLSANENALFIGLKQFLQKEAKPNEIKKLMEIVSLSFTTSNLNEALKKTMFIAKVFRFLTSSPEVNGQNKKTLEKKMKNITRLCFEADILLISAEDDSYLASIIVKGISDRKMIRIEMEREVGFGQLQLSSLEDVFNKYAYVFIICTNNLRSERLTYYMTEITLINSIYNAKARLIPVVSEDVDRKDVALFLRALKPWKYTGDESIVFVEKLVDDAYKTIFKD